MSRRSRRVQHCAVLAAVLTGEACAGHRSLPPPARAPAMLIGEFRDDYRGRFTISDSVWFQRPRNRFRVVAWHPEAQFLIAQNAADDPTAPNLWTRIDWISLTDQGQYAWGFCLTAYKASSREAAIATAPPHRTTPRTGCNGFPFTRMQRIAAADSNATR